MPLPKNGAPWPPDAGTVHGDSVREWSAWYSGDAAQLQTHYAPKTGRTDRPAQFSTGLVGRLARWWWGTPAAVGEQSAKLHVPLAADICGTSADLLFSEPVQLSSESDTQAQFLGQLQVDGLDSRLHEGAEVQAALGGVYLRCMWDTEVQPTPWTTVVHPDGAVPEWRAGRLVAVNLWSQLGQLRTGEVHRHVERHEPGAILHRLFQGTPTNLGVAVPLQDHPATVHLADVVNEDGAQLTETKRLTVSYVPNMLPNRLERHSPQGRSDLQGVTPLLDALDEAYSSWWRDIRHAKARLHVPAQYLDSDGPGDGAHVDVDREVYVPVQGVLGGPGDGLQIHAQQFAIRVAEHAETVKAWTERAVESAGYSTQSLAGGTGGAITAAEVYAHERRSYMTRGKKIRYWTAGLREHLAAQVEVANAHLRAGITPGEVQVEFQDGVQESPMSLANTALAMRNAEAASIATRVAMLHPDWDPVQLAEEVARIQAETGSGEPLPDPTDAGL